MPRPKTKIKTRSRITKKSKTDEKIQIEKLSSVLKLTLKSIYVIITNWKLFTIISAIYFLLTLIFVRGFSSAVNVSQYKNSYLGSHTKATALGSDFSALGNVVTTSFSSNTGNGSMFQTIFFIIFSLLFIWVLRELLNNREVSVKDSFYKSQFPFIQFIIVIFYLIIESIPMTLGLFLYATVFGNGIASDLFEKILWALLALVFVCLSIYLLLGTVFAIFIVTLPNIRPMQAIRSAWKLVNKRRIILFRKIIFLPIALVVAISFISLLFVAILPQISDFVFFALSIVSLLVGISYLYAIYRELI